MGLTGMEILTDVPGLMTLGTSAQAAFASLPSPAKAVDYAAALGLGPGLVLTACQTIDTLKGGPVTLEEVLSILGAQPSGVLAQAISLAKTLAAQIKS